MIMYSIKEGFKVSKKFAQPAGELMAKLESEGRLTAKELVNESRPEDAPLHDYFVWDDALAAERYREDQGRQIMQAIVQIDDSVESEEPKFVKAFYAVEQSGENYWHIETIVQDEDKSEKLYNLALKELRQIERRYEIIRDRLSTVFEAIDSLTA